MKADVTAFVLLLAILGGTAWWLGEPSYGWHRGDWGKMRRYGFHPKFGPHQIVFEIGWNPTAKNFNFYTVGRATDSRMRTYGVEQWDGEWFAHFGDEELPF